MSLTMERVVEANLCHGCGACASLPDVSMQLNDRGFLRPTRPEVKRGVRQDDFETICSGYTMQQATSEGFYDENWGPILDLWTGFSTDSEVRYLGSSGGMISQVLIYLVESGMVDFALQTRADEADPLGNITVASFTRDQILAAAGSRYAPSSPLAGIETHLSSGRRFAFVGKPCDVAALKRLAAVDARINKQIPIFLSFFCAGVPSRHGAVAVLNRLKVESADVSKFEFRGRGWPGLTRATRHNGTEATMDYNSSWGSILSRYLQFRCKICPDGTGEFADIVCADAWYGKDGYPDFSESDGRSLVIARTSRGRSLLNAVASANLVELSGLDIREIQKMQPYQYDRKRAVLARLGALRLSLRRIPRFAGFRLGRLSLRSNPLWLLKNALGMLRRLPATPPGS